MVETTAIASKLERIAKLCREVSADIADTVANSGWEPERYTLAFATAAGTVAAAGWDLDNTAADILAAEWPDNPASSDRAGTHAMEFCTAVLRGDTGPYGIPLLLENYRSDCAGI